ncbi:FkbM family methyltransferase [Roseibium sp. SCP14]|uniref:FkbM family methyltransferase n=1 Tax=Roseibium sp. SCP14 TaxID=3141375 RepID=UPI0033399D0A
MQSELTKKLREKFFKFRRRVFHLMKKKRVTVGGIRLISDRTIVPKDIVKYLYDDSYEQDERILVEKYLKEGDRVLEIGAGIGLVSLTCARIVGVDNLLSYEPNKRTQDIIRQNFALNNLTPQLRNKAIALNAGQIEFFISDNVISSSLIDRNLDQRQLIECDSMADVLAEFLPNVLVMDVEGAEVELLGQSDLSTVDKIVVEVHPHVVGADEVARMVSKLADKGFLLNEEQGQCHMYVKRQ